MFDSTKPPVMLTQTDIDPELQKLQMEWADLLMNDDIVINVPQKCDLSSSEKELLAGRWFDDGVLGWKIDYPQNEFQLKCYRITRSRRFLQVYTVLFFLHLCSPFMGEPYCPWQKMRDHETISLFSTDNGEYLPRLAINLFDLFCTLVYIFEIGLRLVVNNGKERNNGLPVYKDKWILIRLICASLLFADVIVFLASQRPVRFARCLIPMIYIARRNSMRQMVHGLFLSFTKSIPILMFLVMVQFFWSFLGYVVFRGVDVNYGDRFGTFGETMLTVLQSATSRSFSILALTPYYEVNSTSTLFFMALTIAADLICINLIVAVGNRQYKKFSGVLFKRQLRNRRQAFVAIHDLLSDDRGFISRDTWVGFCSNIQGKYSVTCQLAEALFSLECEKDNSKASFDCIDCIGLFRLSALLSARVAIDVTKPAAIEKSEENVRKSSFDGSCLTEETLKKRDSVKMFISNPILDAPEKVSAESRNERSRSDPSTGPSLTQDNFDESACMSRPSVRQERSSSYTPRQKIPSRLEYRSRIESTSKVSTDVHAIDETELITAGSMSTTPFEKLFFLMRLKAVQMIKYNIPLDRLLPSYLIPKNSSMNISPFECFFCAVKLLLAIQLVFMSRRSHTLHWIRLGWVLEALLWMEMIFFMFAWGFMVYFRRGGFGYIFSLNILTLVFMIMLGTSNDSGYYSTQYFCLLIFQSARYFVLVRYLSDSDLFISLMPLLLRVLFIIFCFVYFFSVIGYNRLCGVFNSDHVNDDADDDAAIWLNFENMFNFNTLLQTMYTLFYVAMLGNWTYIMDAAAQTERVPSLFYFYTFRLLMVLVVIPIMFSFIIQAFIAKRDKDAKAKGTDEVRLSDHLRIVGTYQFEQSGTSAGGDDKSTEEAVDRALQRVVSKRNTLSQSHRHSVSSYDMVGSDSFNSRVRSEKDALRRWNQGNLSVQDMFEAYAAGKLFGDDGSDSSPSASTNESQSQKINRSKSNMSMFSKSSSSLGSKYPVKKGEKSASMMTYWSGDSNSSLAKSVSAKDKKKAQILERMLEETLNQIALERNNLESINTELDRITRK